MGDAEKGKAGAGTGTEGEDVAAVAAKKSKDQEESFKRITGERDKYKTDADALRKENEALKRGAKKPDPATAVTDEEFWDKPTEHLGKVVDRVSRVEGRLLKEDNEKIKGTIHGRYAKSIGMKAVWATEEELDTEIDATARKYGLDPEIIPPETRKGIFQYLLEENFETIEAYAMKHRSTVKDDGDDLTLPKGGDRGTPGATSKLSKEQLAFAERMGVKKENAERFA